MSEFEIHPAIQFSRELDKDQYEELKKNVTTPPAKAGGFLGNGNCLSVDAYRLRPSPQRPCENVPRGVDVPVQDQTTVGAAVNSNREFLSDLTATPTTRLARHARVDFYDRNTGTFGLVSQRCQEASPRGIGNRPTQPMVPDHPLDVQALHRDEAVATAQIQGSLVSVVASQILNFSVKPTQVLRRLLAVLASLFLAANCATGSAQGWEFRLEISRVGLVMPVTRGQEALKPNVDTNRRIVAGGHDNFAEVAGQDDVPLVAFEFQCCGLDFSFNRTVGLALDQTDMLNPEFTGWQKPNAISVGRELYRVEPALSLEAGIAGLVAGLDATKESLKRAVQPTHCSLRRREVQLLKPLIDEPLVLEPRGLVGVVKTDAVQLVGQFPLFKTGVVEPAVSFDHNPKLPLLVAVGVEAELEGSTQELLSLLVFDVLADRRVGHTADRGDEVAPAPQSGQLGAKTIKLLSENMRGVPLKALSHFRRAPTRVRFNEQVNVVGHYFQGVKGPAKLPGLLLQQSPEPSSHPPFKNRSPVLGAPDEVILERENRPGILDVSGLHAPNIHPSAQKVTTKTKGGGRAFLCRLKPTVPGPSGSDGLRRDMMLLVPLSREPICLRHFSSGNLGQN